MVPSAIGPMESGAAQILANRESYSEDQIKLAETTLDQAGIDPSMLDTARLGMLAMGDSRALEGLIDVGAQAAETEIATQTPAFATDNVGLWGDDSQHSLGSMEAMHDRSVMNNSHTSTATDQDLQNVELQARAATVGAGDQSTIEDQARMAGAADAVESAANKAALQAAGADYMINAQPGESVSDFEERIEEEQHPEQNHGLIAGAFSSLSAALAPVIATIRGWITPGQEQGTDIAMSELGGLTPNGPQATREIGGRTVG